MTSFALHKSVLICNLKVRPRMSKYPTISISHSTSVLVDMSNINLHWSTESHNYYFVTNGNQHEPTIDLSSFLSMFNHSLDGLHGLCGYTSSNGNPQASIWESVPFRDLVHHSVPFRRIDPTNGTFFQLLDNVKLINSIVIFLWSFFLRVSAVTSLARVWN